MKNLSSKELLQIHGGTSGFELPWWLKPLEDWLIGGPEQQTTIHH